MNDAPQESATEESVESSPPPIPSTESVADTNSRPDWLPEKFQTPEDLAKSYGELSTKIGQREEDIKASVLQELETEAYANRPDTAGDYQIPEILDDSEAATNPLLKWWADYSWENGLSQDEFDEGITKWAEFTQQDEIDLEQVKTDLGDNANSRIEAVQLFMNKFFPEDVQDAVAELGSSAEGIKALEHIQQALSNTSIGQNITSPSKLSLGDIEARMRDPRYYDPARRDRAYVESINEDFKKLYG